MNEEIFKEKQINKEIEQVKPEVPAETYLMDEEKKDINDYVSFLETLRQYKKHITTEPTWTPRTYLNQIEFFDNETGTVKLFLFVRGYWRSIVIS